MQWIVNSVGEDFQNILFEYDERNWEITIDLGFTNDEVNFEIVKRIDELTDDFLTKGSYDYSDLIVDRRKKHILDGNENNQ